MEQNDLMKIRILSKYLELKEKYMSLKFMEIGEGLVWLEIDWLGPMWVSPIESGHNYRMTFSTAREIYERLPLAVEHVKGEYNKLDKLTDRAQYEISQISNEAYQRLEAFPEEIFLPINVSLWPKDGIMTKESVVIIKHVHWGSPRTFKGESWDES